MGYIFLYLFLFIATIVFCASIVPLCQYVYYRVKYKDEPTMHYTFSNSLFNRHMQHDIGLNDVRHVIGNSDLYRLKEIEMEHDLP